MAELTLTNAVLKDGSIIKIKGNIPQDADRFSINLGSDSQNLAFHFNPRFQDNPDGGVIVCNSMSKGSWQAEGVIPVFPFKKGTDTELTVRVKSSMFEVECPENVKVEFPDRLHLPSLTYVFVYGNFNVTFFEIH
ncbi:galectin-1-like [Lepisosteus oculatus]|uniref:galectin-1-like n=1 Tax=Lepisosteus oculatus TaxID=7918 RepID=UPI0037151F6C